jgi:hypothetical protein
MPHPPSSGAWLRLWGIYVKPSLRKRAEPWREATARDREQWLGAFGCFLARLSPTFATTTTTTAEDDDR